MQELEVYMPLADLPSFNVHEVLAHAYLELGDKRGGAAVPASSRRDARAPDESNRRRNEPRRRPAHRDGERHRRDDAARWGRSKVDMRGIPHQGREILEVTYD